MKVLILFLILKLSLNAQNSYTFETIPKLIFANYTGNGIIPAGFELKKINPSISFGLTINKKLYKNFNICLGTNYHINNYYSKYYKDFDSNKKYAFNSSLLRSLYFEPKILLQLNEIKILNQTNFFIELGLGYSISNTPVFSYKSTLTGENVYGDIDTVIIKTTLKPTSNSKLKLLFNFGKKVVLGKSNFQLGIGLNFRFSENETLIEKEITDNGKFYKFDYFRNSTYIGLNLNLTYLKHKTSKD